MPHEDWGDAFVCPGFHDAHQHVFHAALFPSELATEYVGTSGEDCVAHMRAWEQTHPGEGWLVSHGWRENLWDIPRVPTRASLDAAFPHRPVALYSGDAHTLWVNTRGLEALGITDDTEPPAGGSFDRDERGRLTGVLREAAGSQSVPPATARSSNCASDDSPPAKLCLWRQRAAQNGTWLSPNAQSDPHGVARCTV